MLCPLEYSDEEFNRYLDGFLSLLPRGRFIPPVSDNVMPEADIERVRRVSERLAAA